MEKGSFHPSTGAPPTQSTHTTSIVQKRDEMVRHIPLPNQLPKGIDFLSGATGNFSSAALESLISQNEDLMARLSVSLRRTTILEERGATLETENSSLKSRVQANDEKMLILREKDRMNSSRSAALHAEAVSAKASSAKLEKLYADLYVQTQKMRHRLQTLERYRVRVRRASAEIKARAKQVDSLKERLQTFDANLSQVINSYEARLSTAKAQIDEVRGRAMERDQILAEKIRLENQMLFEQRQFQQSREATQAELERLETDSSDLRTQLKEALVRSEGQRLELERVQMELPNLREETRALRDQVESLQALWGHREREFQQLEEKNRNLQQLNQALSANLNQQRREVQDMKLGVERDLYSKQEKIKNLQTEIQILRQELKSPKT